MKKFKIVYEGWESLKEDVGTDYVFFHCNVYPENKDEDPFPVSLPLDSLMKELRKSDPETYALFERAEKNVSKWGPNHSGIIRELLEYGIDPAPLVVRVIEQTYPLEKEELRWIELRKDAGPPADDIFESLQEAAAGAKKENEYYELLCNRIEKALTREVTELFPVIINASSEHIKKLESILIDHIPNLAEDLVELIFDAEESAGES